MVVTARARNIALNQIASIAPFRRRFEVSNFVLCLPTQTSCDSRVSKINERIGVLVGWRIYFGLKLLRRVHYGLTSNYAKTSRNRHRMVNKFLPTFAYLVYVPLKRVTTPKQ